MSETITLIISVVSLLVAIAVATYNERYWSQPAHKGYWTARDERREARRMLRRARRESKRWS